MEHGLELLPSGHCSIKCHPQTTELSNHQTQLAAPAFTHFLTTLRLEGTAHPAVSHRCQDLQRAFPWHCCHCVTIKHQLKPCLDLSALIFRVKMVYKRNLPNPRADSCFQFSFQVWVNLFPSCPLLPRKQDFMQAPSLQRLWLHHLLQSHSISVPLQFYLLHSCSISYTLPSNSTSALPKMKRLPLWQFSFWDWHSSADLS